MDALISDCGQYRYWLSRKLDGLFSERKTALFIMLNPSTADAHQDDPTIRRCMGFAGSWGCSDLVVANLYAYRATDPKELWKVEDAVGPDNMAWLERLAREHGEVVCAWGANARANQVELFRQSMVDVGARLWCLGTTKAGAPKHPLYLKADQERIPWL